MLTGWKTFIVGLLGVIGVPALTYIAGVDWTALGVSPVTSAVISSGIFMILRVYTTTSIFKPTAVPTVAAMDDDELRKAGIAKILTASNPVGRKLAELSPGHVVQEVGNTNPQTGMGRRAI